MNIAPMAFFVFNRPKQTARVFAEIRRARPEHLVIIGDGPRSGRHGESEMVAQTRAITENVDWPCTVSRVYAESNLGLRERILTGLDFTFAKYPQAIVLEDDCLPDLSFFSYASELLDKYSENPVVGTIAGSNFAPYKGEFGYHFSKSHYIWGWASWRRTWEAFRSSPQVESWSEEDIRALRPGFASRDQASGFFEMMRQAKALNTWDVSFAVWLRQNDLLATVPKFNLIENIGFGEGATHTVFESFDVHVTRQTLAPPIRHPQIVSWDDVRERRMWRSKRMRWIIFPLSHPLDFLRRVLAYLGAR